MGFWTPERVVQCTAMWLGREHSANAIGKILGCSRNAVVAKMARAGLKGGLEAYTPTSASEWEKQKPRRSHKRREPEQVRERVVAAEPLDDVEVLPAATGVSLMDLRSDQCPFPIGDPKDRDFKYCGAPKDGAYCGFHNRVCLQPVIRKDRSLGYWRNLS